MAHIDLSRAHSVFELDGFEGIDGSKIFSGKGGIKNMTDFRIKFDGSVEKRYGFEPLAQLPGTPRAVHRIQDNELLLLIENDLYSLDLISGIYTLLDSLDYPSEGDASFIEHGGHLYLIDGREMYIYLGKKLYIAEGYIPLYGRRWGCEDGGPINEPLNLLTKHVRISFETGISYRYIIKLPFKISSVDFAFIDGELDLTTDYKIAENKKAITPLDLPANAGELTLFLTLDDSVIDRSSLTSCRYSASFGNIADKSTAVFYGGSDSSVIFPSRQIDDEDPTDFSTLYPGTFNIYVPVTDCIKLSGSASSITAACPKDDSLMIFTERSAYLLSNYYPGENELIKVSSCFGSSSRNGVILVNDRPISVSFSGILKWIPYASENYEFNTECISQKIQADLDDRFAKNAFPFHYQSKNEIWFCDPSDPSGTVKIYSPETDSWFYFTGIGADRLFEINGEVGFLKGNVFYLFSPSLTDDHLSDQILTPTAVIESGIIMLDPLNESKKLLRCLIRSSKGASICLSITDAKGRTVVYPFSDSSGEQIGYIEKRLDLHRSRYYSFSIFTNQPTVIYGVTFIAQK